MYFRAHELGLRNFMSFGNALTKICLNFVDPTMIVGQNFDSAVDGQLDSNGAGKTTISNGLNYALFDTIVSGQKVNADDLINNINKKDMQVYLTFETDNQMFYKVERYRRNKTLGGNGVRLYERAGGSWDDEFTNDHDITPDSVINTNAKIASILGMDFEVFSRIVAFSASHKPFLFLPAGEQTAIMEEICGLTELSDKAAVLKKHITTNKDTIEKLDEVNATIKAQRKQIEAQIQSTYEKIEAWDARHAGEIKQLEDEITTREADDIDYEEQIALFEYVQRSDEVISGFNADRRELQSSLLRLEGDLGKADQWDASRSKRLDDAKEKHESFTGVNTAAVRTAIVLHRTTSDLTKIAKADLTSKNSELLDLEKRLTEKSKEYGHLVGATCPYCSQTFKDTKAKLAEVNAEIAIIEELLPVVRKEIQGQEQAVLEYTTILAEAVEAMGQFITEAALDTWMLRRDNAKAQVESVVAEVNPYSTDNTLTLAEIEDIKDDIEKLDNMITKRTVKRDETKASLHYTRLQDIINDQNRLTTLGSLLAEKLALSNPLTSTVRELESMKLEETKDAELAVLEDELEHQQFLLKLLTKKDSFVRKVLLEKSLPFLNGRLRGYLDKIGFLHRVTFQEDLTVKISQFGTNIGFGNLSSGQKARINLALSFAFRDMLQSRHNGKLKFCILDECLDVGLGNVGVQLAAKMIKQIATEDKLSMFVISHRDEIASMFDKRLVVQLKSGFSTVVEE